MFNNIGEKLMGLAYVSCIGGIIASFIYGLSFAKVPLACVLIIVLGSLVSWISSWPIYALGEIAANRTAHTRDQETKLKLNNAESNEKIATVFKSISKQNTVKHRCPHCGEIVTSSTCDMCGKENNLYD